MPVKTTVWIIPVTLTMGYGAGISTDIKKKAPFGKGSLLYLMTLFF